MESAHVVKSILVGVIVRVRPGYSHLSGTGITQTFTIVQVYRGAIVGAIARPDGEVIVPRGGSSIEAGDRVIFFALESVVSELEAAFLS